MAYPIDSGGSATKPKPTAKPGTTTTGTSTSTTTTTTKKGQGSVDPAVKQGQAEWWSQYKDIFARYNALFRSMQGPTAGQQIREAQGLYPDYSGNILSDIQLRRNASADVQGVMGPQIQQILDLYKRRGAQGAAAISGLTGSYINRLGDISTQTQAANQGIYGQQQGLDAALANFSSDRNTQMPELTAALQGMNASPELTAQTAGLTGALGRQGAVDVAALGSSTLGRMGQEAIASNAYAGLQPGFAKQTGQQQLGMFESGLNEQMQTDVGDITAKMPELVLSVYNNLLTNNNTQRQLAAQRGQTLVGAAGDAQTNALNSRISQAAVLQNLLQAAGGTASDFLTAFTNAQTQGGTTTTTQTTTGPPAAGSTSDPYAIIGEAAGKVGTAFYNDRNFNVAVQNDLDAQGLNPPDTPKQRAWAWWHPVKALNQIENSLSKEAKGKVPKWLVHQRALEIMQGLGLRTPDQWRAVKAAGGGGSTTAAGSGVAPGGTVAGPPVSQAGTTGSYGDYGPVADWLSGLFGGGLNAPPGYQIDPQTGKLRFVGYGG